MSAFHPLQTQLDSCESERTVVMLTFVGRWTSRIGIRMRDKSEGRRLDDTAYLVERAQQELTAAIKSSDSRVRNVHVNFALAYLLRLRDAQLTRRRSEMRL